MVNLPVLLIPGTLCTGAVFEYQIKTLAALAPRLEVVQFHLEDSITKMADKAIEMMLPGSPVAVIGFSMGGMVAMEIARKAPQMVGKLALLNTRFDADPADTRAARLLHLEQAKTESMETVIRQHYLDRYLHHPLAKVQKLIIDMACELGSSCFEAQIRAHTSRQDSSTSLPDIKCPTLILGGKQDVLCPPLIQMQMHQMIQDSELVILDDCGHFSMLEKPDEVNRVLQHWYM